MGRRHRLNSGRASSASPLTCPSSMPLAVQPFDDGHGTQYAFVVSPAQRMLVSTSAGLDVATHILQPILTAPKLSQRAGIFLIPIRRQQPGHQSSIAGRKRLQDAARLQSIGGGDQGPPQALLPPAVAGAVPI